MRYTVIIIALMGWISVFSQYEGPIPPITDGYGSLGPNTVDVTNIPNDYFAERDISIFYPAGTTEPLPTIFFLHGWGGVDTLYYIETIRNIVSNGYSLVYVPYKTFGVNAELRYSTMRDGFLKAARTLTQIIDTTHVGFYGHSFGGGAVPSISYNLFTKYNWGLNGRFIYTAAPYYSYELEAENLNDFPTDCHFLMLLFEEDDVNDHRIGMDIFNNIAISKDNKDCITVHSKTVEGYNYAADHGLNVQYTSNSVFNALDYQVTFRLLQALADHTFNGSTLGENVALGNGSEAQVDMGSLLPDLSVTDEPSPIFPQDIYASACSDQLNERRDFCQMILNAGSVDSDKRFTIYPNPASDYLWVQTHSPAHEQVVISIINVQGQVVWSGNRSDYGGQKIAIQYLKEGTYVVLTSRYHQTDSQILTIRR